MLGLPGFLTGFAEALVIGLIAGVIAVRVGPASGRRGPWVWPFVLGGAALLLLGSIVLPEAFACSAKEREVFMEFDQYGGLRVEPTGNPEISSCAAYYQTRGSTDELFAYFREQLEENGWDERPAESYRIVREGAEEACVPMDLIAERGGFRYRIVVEEADPEAGGHAPGSGVAAQVFGFPEDDRSLPTSGPPPGCRLRSPREGAGR